MFAANQQRVSITAQVTAAVGGLDDASPVANMSPEFAIELVNFFPEGGALRVRDGYREQVTGLVKDGLTLMAFRAGDPSDDRMFVCTDDGIYDATAQTDTPVLLHPLTSGAVSWTQFSNIAGTWLIGCNGVDPAFLYNGTTFVDFVADPTPGAPGEINGLSPTDIVGVLQHKNRLWFIEKNSLSAFYWPLNAVAGTVTEFPLGGIAQLGGRLNAIFTWTMDAAYSVDDMMFFQTSVGELLAYGGTDPANAETWFLSARYFAGAPLSNRAHTSLNGDMLLLTEFGLVSLAKVVAGQQSAGAKELTTSYRISASLTSLIRARTGPQGWEVTYSPSMQYLILSIPDLVNGVSLQYVMNAVSGAWTTFDLPALTFLEYDGFLYFTDDTGRVLRHGDTSADNIALDGTGATAITAGFKQAYNYFDQPGVSKHYKLVRPIFESTIPPSYRIAVSPDFSPYSLRDMDAPGAGADSGFSLWGVGLWDEALWSPPLLAFQEWQGVTGVGYCASLVCLVSTTSPLRYVAAMWVYEGGISL